MKQFELLEKLVQKTPEKKIKVEEDMWDWLRDGEREITLKIIEDRNCKLCGDDISRDPHHYKDTQHRQKCS